MSETLWGVMIGGLIGSVGPLVSAILSEKRWRKEKLLEYLKAERERKERICAETLVHFREGLATESVHAPFVAAIWVNLPPYVEKVFDKYMESGDKSDLAKRTAVMEMTVALQRVLKDADGEIRAVLA